jgi:6-pyruvoyltetrahydropterin/6-carboxytetrahydropterin synthase
MYKIRVKEFFSSAHFLRNYKGKCENLHGHNWKVEIVVARRSLDQNGMVMDFSDLKKILKEVLSELDHKCLNNLDYFKKKNPSSEEIAHYIYLKISRRLPKNIKVEEVIVWETPKACAIYKN